MRDLAGYDFGYGHPIPCEVAKGTGDILVLRGNDQVGTLEQNNT